VISFYKFVVDFEVVQFKERFSWIDTEEKRGGKGDASLFITACTFATPLVSLELR
jgi:hypothetical protein